MAADYELTSLTIATQSTKMFVEAREEGLCLVLAPFWSGKRLYTLAILVWNRAWFLREQRDCMNVFYIVSIPNGVRKKENMRIRNALEEFFCLRSNLSNDNIISA